MKREDLENIQKEIEKYELFLKSGKELEAKKMLLKVASTLEDDLRNNKDLQEIDFQLGFTFLQVLLKLRNLGKLITYYKKFKSYNFSEQDKLKLDLFFLRVLTTNKNSLEYLDFSNMSFGNIDLSNANLTGCKFVNSKFYKTIFTNANLQLSNFESAYLKDVNFNNAILRKTYWRGAELDGVKMINVNLQNSYFVNTKFNKVDLEKSVLDHCRFVRSILRKTNFKMVNMEGANADSCDMSMSNFERANILFTNFEDTNLSFSNIENAKFQNCEFIRVNMEGLDQAKASFLETKFSGTVLRSHSKAKMFKKGEIVKEHFEIEMTPQRLEKRAIDPKFVSEKHTFGASDDDYFETYGDFEEEDTDDSVKKKIKKIFKFFRKKQ